MPHYEVTVLDRIPVQGGPPIFSELSRIIPLGGESSGASGGLSWSRELCSEGFINVATQPESLPESVQTRIVDMKNNPMELVVLRDGVVRQHGPLVSWQIEGNTLILQARGMLYYLRYMTLLQDKNYNQDQALIVQDLINTFQSQDYGNYGIDTTSITSHGVTREREYKRTELLNIAKEVRALGEADNGFDVDIDYVSRDLILTNPQQGTDKSNSVFLDSRGLVNPNFAYSLAAGSFGSSAAGSGRTEDNVTKFSVQEDATTRQNFGRSFVTTNVFGVATQAEIDSYVTQAMVLSRNPYFVPSREYIAVTGAGVDDFDAGDTVSFIYDPGFGAVTIVQDVKNINVSVSPDGNEKLNVEFV